MPQLKASLIDYMGGDAAIVNAARVSFNKRVDGPIQDRDKRLIRYLARHQHMSPFRHCFLSFRCRAPIALARQLDKHQIGLSKNEISRRYVTSKPMCFRPGMFRQKPDGSIKQGSGDAIPTSSIGSACRAYETAMETALNCYERLLELNVAPEQARMVLPQAMMTEWIWSGTLEAFVHLIHLRGAENAQADLAPFVNAIHSGCCMVAPVATHFLLNGGTYEPGSTA